MGIDGDRVFRFTEDRVEEAIRLVRSGAVQTKGNGRRLWRDGGSPHGLHIAVGRQGATFYRIAKVAGRKVETRIGDATAMRVTKAREAARKLAAGVADAAAAPIRVRTDGPTVSQAWADYVADATSGEFIAGRKRTSASTLASYGCLYEAHLRKQYGSRSLHALAKDVIALHRRLRDKPVTANRLLQVVSNLFVHAARSGKWDKPNPTIDQITGRAIRKYAVASRERWLTTAEAARVMSYAANECEPWRDFWRLLILTGVRVSNLREMQWTELDLRESESFWRIPKTKNGSAHVVPLTNEAVTILRDRLERIGKPRNRRKAAASPWVFPMKKDPSRCINDCDHAWSRVRKHAALADVRIHDLRRTAGSWATQAGAPLTAVGRFIGDRSINATAVYARVDTAASRHAAELVEKRLVEAMEVKP
jgi:integrase